jgi:hypothetical protein
MIESADTPVKDIAGTRTTQTRHIAVLVGQLRPPLIDARIFTLRVDVNAPLLPDKSLTGKVKK